MAVTGKEPIGSMGTDTPLAVFSQKPQLIYNYFKQLFAQVTNPPLDGIREELITDISMAVGADYNLFEVNAEHCRKLRIKNPIISKEDLEKIKTYDNPDFQSETISILYEVKQGLNALEDALEAIIDKVERAVNEGKRIIILSDRGTTADLAPIPALLATSYVS